MFLARLFKKRPLIVEMPSASPIAKLDAEMAMYLKALPANPAFTWLVQRLELQAQFLSAQLQNQPHGSLREVDQLQAGIFWCRWLQRQITEATNLPPRKQRDAEDFEMELFRKLNAQLECVGSAPDTP